MANRGLEVDHPAGVEVVPDIAGAAGEGVAQFAFDDHPLPGQLERQLAVVGAAGHEPAGAAHRPGVVAADDVADRPGAILHPQAPLHLRQRIGEAGVVHRAVDEADRQGIGVADGETGIAFMPEDKIEDTGGAQRTDDRLTAGGHRGEHAVVDAHRVAADLESAGRPLRRRPEGPFDVDRTPAGLPGEMDGHRTAVDDHGADGAVDAVRETIVGERRVPATDRDLRVDRAQAAGELGAQINLAGGEKPAPLHLPGIGKEPFPLPVDDEAIGLEEEVEVGITAPSAQPP